MDTVQKHIYSKKYIQFYMYFIHIINIITIGFHN
jgi:hypothetical protein